MSEAELPNIDEREDIKRMSFTRPVALATAIYAVVIAFASLEWKNITKEALLARQQASDQ